MKIVSNQKRSIVYFNEKDSTYIKIFKPKFINKLKYFLRLRKYPGDNFKFISVELKKLGISTVTILNYTHYSVITEKIDGISLEKYLTIHKDSKILNDYINLVVTLLKNNIYCGDLSYDNFFVMNKQIIALDLEDYRKVKFFKRSSDEALRRLQGKIDDSVLEKIKKVFHR